MPYKYMNSLFEQLRITFGFDTKQYQFLINGKKIWKTVMLSYLYRLRNIQAFTYKQTLWLIYLYDEIVQPIGHLGFRGSKIIGYIWETYSQTKLIIFQIEINKKLNTVIPACRYWCNFIYFILMIKLCSPLGYIGSSAIASSNIW